MYSPWQLRLADFWGSVCATVALAILRGDLYVSEAERSRRWTARRYDDEV